MRNVASGALDGVQGQHLVDLLHRLALLNQAVQGIVVVSAASDGLLKDRRVGGDTPQAVVNQGLQVT